MRVRHRQPISRSASLAGRLLPLLAIVVAAAAPPVHGQGSATDETIASDTLAGYRRAELVPRYQRLHRPFKPRIHWLDDGGVWFETTTGDGPRSVTIAADGTRREGATPAELGLAPPAPPILEPRRSWGPSRPGGDETEIVLVNALDRPVRLFWVDPDGRPRAYGTLDPGAEKRQHTFAGHVWLGDFTANDIAGVFVATSAGGRAVFDAASRARATGQPAAAREPEAPAAPEVAVPRVVVRDHDLFLVAADGEHTLTADGSADDSYAGAWHVSPDGTRAFGFKTLPAERRELVLVESSPTDRLQPKTRRIDYLKPGDRIAVPRPCLFDLVARRPIPLDAGAFPDPWSIDEVRWADDSREVTCLYNRRGHRLLRLVAIDATTGALRTIVEETSPTFIDYSQKTFLHWLPGGRELVWMSERDGRNHFYVVDVATGSARQLTSGSWNVRRVERVDPERREVWLTALGIAPGEDPYHRHLVRVGIDDGRLTRLTVADGTHEWTISPDGTLFIDRWSRVDHPWVTELRRTVDGSLVAELGRDDPADLLAAGFRPPQRFVAKGRDGATDIHGIIIRPSTFDPRRRYPVIESIYAGPQDHHVPKAWGFQPRERILAELGFVVVQIDGMGTNWRSKAFHDVCHKNLADGGFPDRIAWLKAAAAAHPELDRERVGIFGGSAGGQNALAALLHHGDFYHAAAADCGCHDNRMDKIWWNEAWMGWPVGEEYAANSNVVHAAKLSGALLLTVGELDTNVDPSSTLQVAKALIDAGKEFEMVVVPGGGHGVGETPYLVRKRQDFFVRSLLGVEPTALVPRRFRPRDGGSTRAGHFAPNL
jgi:dipeptidyl aminopeptidase/acylaminoacyl peptidase